MRAAREVVVDRLDQDVEEGQEAGVANRRFIIAIDGPAAAGKSTVGEIVARRIDAVYFDTGLLYRALTHVTIARGVPPGDEPGVAACARSLTFTIGQPSVEDGRQSDVVVDGEDITPFLRRPEVDRAVSVVAAYPDVRKALLEQQRRIAASGRVVMVGRDIGTVVLPDAELKIFLDATPGERARRRFVQTEGTAAEQSLETIMADLIRRDEIDSARDIAPLRPADDAVIIDTDALTIAQVADCIVDQARRRMGPDSP